VEPLDDRFQGHDTNVACALYECADVGQLELLEDVSTAGAVTERG